MFLCTSIKYIIFNYPWQKKQNKSLSSDLLYYLCAQGLSFGESLSHSSPYNNRKY